MLQELLNSINNGSGGSFSGFAKKYFLKPLLGFSFIDALDILVLFVLILWVYRFIRERRAGKLAIGLIFLLLISFLSSVLEMRAVSNLLQNFYQVGILAIVVIFQPELRDALERMGNTPSNIKNIGGNKNNSGIASLVSVLSDAACSMSAEKTGALIVIERTTKLGEFIDTGVQLDALPSKELIRNIFFNRSPLHDGAVVIRNGRICAAGCILPSSQSESVFVDMGTRHRAAVGISEISDAVILIVSEETGIISIANNGIIKRNYNSGSLKEDLFLLLAATPYESPAEADFSTLIPKEKNEMNDTEKEKDNDEEQISL